MEYQIRHVPGSPELAAPFDGADWTLAETGRVDCFHARSSAHHPDVRFRMLYAENGLYLKYALHDCYVLARATRFQDIVCRDSCVEFLVKPDSGEGYVSFEMNCIGTLLSYHITDPTRCDRERTGRFFKAYRELSPAELDDFTIYPTLKGVIDPEIPEAIDYELSLYIPFSMVCGATGAAKPEKGSVWSGNFFKCADDSSHPHWGSWNPGGAELNFHQIEYFGKLIFA